MNITPLFFSGAAALAGVVGWPVAHSLSPAIHNHWLKQHGIDGVYVPLAVAPDHLPAALRALPHLGFRGVNVTVPHKEAALAVMDTVTPVASRIGAVNTVVVQADGTLLGHNTDAEGFAQSLHHGHPGWQPERGPAVVLGAGGAARAVVVALLDAGVPSVVVTNRSRDRADALAAAVGGPVTVADWAEREAVLADAAVLVNTTALGMTGQPPLEMDLARLPETAVVTDIVYSPQETRLLRQAADRGNPAVEGIGMLLHQAVPGFRAWFGVDVNVTPGLRKQVLHSREQPPGKVVATV